MSLRQDCGQCRYYAARPSGDFDGYCKKNEHRVTDCSVCVCFKEKGGKKLALTGLSATSPLYGQIYK